MFGRKKGEGEPRPAPVVEAEIAETDANLSEMFGWLHEATDQGDLEAAIDLMREAGERRLALMDERKSLLERASELHQEGRIEQAQEVAEVVAQADVALQDSVQAQQRAEGAMQRAREIVDAEPLSETEIGIGARLVDEVMKGQPELLASDKSAATRRAARLLRVNDELAAKDQLVRELAGIGDRPKAWEDVSWTVR